MKKRRLLTAIKYILFLVVGLSIIYYLFKTYYTTSFINIFKAVNLKWLSISIISALLAHVFRAFCWRLMIIPLTNKKPSFINVFNALMVGYLVNLALPRAGELARCAWLAKKEKIDLAKLVGSVIAERIFDVLILFVLVLYSLLHYQGLFLKVIHFNSIMLKPLFIVLVLMICLVVMGFLIMLANKKHRFTIAVTCILRKLWDGFISVRKIQQRAEFVLLTLGIWFFYIASSYFAFKMLPQTDLLVFVDALLCVVAGSFGMIAPIQGGIGAFHFMVTKSLILLGVANTPALVYATVIHASQTLTVMLFGLLAFAPKVKFLSRETRQATFKP